MLHKFVPALTLVSISLSSVAALAAGTCDPAKLAASVDVYANEPFGARSWRVLRGLGDPNIDATSVDYNNWQAIDSWKKLVSEIAPDLAGVQDPGYECRMAYPMQVLNDRVQTFGKTSPYVKQWLMAQAPVMAACSGGPKVNFDLPPALGDQKADVNAIQTFDRDYQTASIAFYTDKVKALELFKAIAATASPHKAYARYNVANLLANSKDVNGARAEAKAILADTGLASVHGITQELVGYIANIEDTPAGWSDLLDNTLDVLSKPVATINASEKLKADYGRALNDVSYAGLTAKESDWWVIGELPENPTLSKAVVDTAHKSAFATWMLAGQSVKANYNRVSWAMNGDKWNGWATSYIDRAEALVAQPDGLSKAVLDALKAKPDDATRKMLWARANLAMAGAAHSCGDAPETAAAGELLLQAVRLSALAGKFDEAYEGLLASPIKGSHAYSTGAVLKLARYLLATGNAEEGRRLRDKLLTPEFFTNLASGQEDPELTPFSEFLGWVAEDQDHWLAALEHTVPVNRLANRLFNLLPVKTLREISGNALFTEAQKALLQRAAWTRDYAQNRKLNPEATAAMLAANPHIGTDLDATRKAFPKLRADRQWLLTILRNPRFGILVNSPDYTDPIENQGYADTVLHNPDHNDKNWWCPLEPSRQLHTIRSDFDQQSQGDADLSYNKAPLEPAYDQTLADKILTAREKLLAKHPMVKTLNRAEIASLEAIASAPAKLTKAAIAWGKSSKGDDGAPEALALAVQSTYFGCNWHGSHKAYSKPAQELLTTKFKGTEWATQTPYWFDCMWETYDDSFKKVKNCKPHEWTKDTLPK